MAWTKGENDDLFLLRALTYALLAAGLTAHAVVAVAFLASPLARDLAFGLLNVPAAALYAVQLCRFARDDRRMAREQAEAARAAASRRKNNLRP